VQYFLLAFYYLALGRIEIDLFDFNNRDQSKDWMIYLALLVSFASLYGLISSWDTILGIFKKRKTDV
jgi:hypothetical protein